MRILGDSPRVAIAATDMELLRGFEPVLIFTRGEQFYPFDVERYIKNCSLWEHSSTGKVSILVSENDMTFEKLVEPRRSEFGSQRYLRFIEPLSLSKTALVLAEQARSRSKVGHKFQVGQGRLARGGFLPRIIDALFTVSLYLRGCVPVTAAVAAEQSYHAIQKECEKYTYYGRVMRQNGWVVLQYWFFYAYNNWRSGFHGVNDHEADWEMIQIVLYQQDEWLSPEWVAYASHNFHGDDIRRRWDDLEELDVEEGHPVVHVGIGSHACYFRAGEYQAEVTLPLPKWLSAMNQTWDKFWGDTLGQGWIRTLKPFRIPFVDYARGDGLKIGPGQEREWTPALIDEKTPWVSLYRGLWGYYAQDPISGENASPGPMYNRDGTPRLAWSDPLSFCGLDKAVPPNEEIRLLDEKTSSFQRQQQELENQIIRKATEVQGLGIELKSMEGNPHLAKMHAEVSEKADEIAEEINILRQELTESHALLQSLEQLREVLSRGLKDHPQAHLHHRMKPVSNSQTRYNNLTETWAAVSLSLLLLVVAALAYFAPHYLWVGLGILVIIFAVIESILRGTFIQTVSVVTSLLAIITSLVLIFHFWLEIFVGCLLSLSVFLLVQKVRELRS